MIKFGPSGNSESFFAEGHKSTVEAAKWLKDRNLDAFEYPFGRGVNIGKSTAAEIGKNFAENGIEVSVHAPYFINFANPDPEKAENSKGYLLQSLEALSALGGERAVFHPGTEGKRPREEGVELIKRRLKEFMSLKKDAGFENKIICAETMGKFAQIGTVEEVAEFCNVDESIYPCVDFGHVNARTLGSLKTAKDYENVILYLQNAIGTEKTKRMHVHFSKIMYSAKGEVKHLTFADDVYGPKFEPLAEVLVKYNLEPVILSESQGTQAEDAATMKRIYFEKLSKTL